MGEKYLRRPEVEWSEMVERFPELGKFSAEVAQQVTYDCKYSGYLIRQHEQVERQQRLIHKRIPADFAYDTVVSMRNEARQKLSQIRPISLDQASRISGITPADIALLLAHLQSGKSG